MSSCAGLSPDEADTLASNPGLLGGVDLLYLMSHLASGDEADSVQNADQLAAMRKAAALFPSLPVCFANSGGIFLGESFRGAMVRSGIALYGGAPTDAIVLSVSSARA